MSRPELGTMCYSNRFCRLLCVKNSKTSPGCNESLPQIYQRYITKDIDDMDEASSKVAAESVEKALKEEMKAADDGGVTIRGYFGWPTQAHTNAQSCEYAFLFWLPQQIEMRF